MSLIHKYIAKRVFGKKYNVLCERLLVEYELVKEDHSEILNILSKLLISGEDHRFYYHIGFDIVAILRALRNRVFYNKVEGASTIEQQLVRVLTNNFDRTFHRKIQEILLSTTITSIVPKSSIPKIYIRIAYYGAGMNGLDQVYCKLGIINQKVIPIEQAAAIISRIKYPLSENPSQNRLKQIETRKHHLMNLYKKHSTRRYFKIYG